MARLDLGAAVQNRAFMDEPVEQGVIIAEKLQGEHLWFVQWESGRISPEYGEDLVVLE